MAYKWTIPVVILAATASGQSAVQDFGGGQMRMGLIMPAAWTAAHLTFLVSDSPTGTFTPLYTQAGAEVDLTVAVSKAYSLDTTVLNLAPFRWVIVRSGTNAVPVQQGGDRTIYFTFQR